VADLTWVERVRAAVRVVHSEATCLRKGDAFYVYASPGDASHLGGGPLESLAWEHARQVMVHAGNALDLRAP
jgi:hypothetical protein